MNWLALQTMTQISVERILNALPEGILIAVFAWALLRILRKQNSGTRFAVWFLALLSVVALPLLTGFGGTQKQALAGMSSATASWESMRPAINIPASWGLFLFLGWAVSASVAMARLALGLWQLRGLRQSCTPILTSELDPAVRKTVEAIVASKKSVTIVTSEFVRVPAALGFWKRMIVLPAWALRELAPEDLNVILLHEFAHLRRGDDWTNLVQKIVRGLFFFHPAVWWIDSRLSVEREMACDDAVLAETANPHGYATCLVSLLEKSLAHGLAHRLVDEPRSSSLAHAAVDRAREAALRLAQILATKRPVATRVWKPALAMVAAFSVVCLALLPHAPQFVAFDQGVRASNSDHAYSAAVSQPSFPLLPSTSGEPGVPARLDGRDARCSTTRPRAASHRLPSVPVVSARLNAEAARDQVVAVRANAEREIVPQFQTLVFIEATQYRTADSSGWSVQVWRVTWVSTVPDRLARVPAGKSI